MDKHRGELKKEYSLEELEELKLTAKVPPFQDTEVLSVDDYLNKEQDGPLGIPFSIQEQDGTKDTVVAAETSDKNVEENIIIVDQTVPQGENAEGSNAEKEENTAVRGEASDKNTDEKLVMVEPVDGQIADKSNQTKREDTLSTTNASDNNADVKSIEEGQNKIENSTKGKKKIDMANYSIEGKGESSGGASDDDNHADKMALITVPLDQGQNIGQPSVEKAQIGESSQVPKVTIISRAISYLPLHLRLRGWQIREHPRRDLKRKDKFYVHLQSDVQFRSLNEVDDFVQWGLHPKRQIRKPLLVDPQNSGLQLAPKEGPPAKRSTRRKLAWEFHNRKFITDGIVICDIKFPGEPDVIEDDTGSRGSQETGSSERTMSVKSSDPEERDVEEEEEEKEDDNEDEEEEAEDDDDDDEEEEGYTEAEVRAFFAEAYENLRNVRPEDDESPPQQQMNNYEAAASSSTESTSSSAPTASPGGKRTQKEDDPEEGPSSKKPRV